MNYYDDIFLKNLPCIDLHGFDRESARVKTEDFILENTLLNNEKFIIIHGIGEGIIKHTVHNVLSKNKIVVDYKVDNFNPGCTIVRIKIDK